MLRFREVFVGVVFASTLFLAWTWSRPAAAQACSWQGTSPFCSGSCGAGESEQTREGSDPGFVDNSTGGAIPFGASCLTGTKALCCKTPRSTCRWAGTAPFCDGQCSGSETKQTPPEGSSSGNSCWTGSKVYCCTSQPSSSGQPLVTAAYYRLQVKQGGKYLDAVNCSDSVALNPGSSYANGACQLWRFVPAGDGWNRLQLKQGGKYLDATYCSDKVALSPGSSYANGACQLWRFVPAGGGWSRLQVKQGGKYLDAVYCSDKLALNPGSTYANGACQLWRLVAAPAG